MVSKDEKLFVRCTTTQKARWEQAALRDRRELSDWVRIMLDDAADASEKADEQESK